MIHTSFVVEATCFVGRVTISLALQSVQIVGLVRNIDKSSFVQQDVRTGSGLTAAVEAAADPSPCKLTMRSDYFHLGAGIVQIHSPLLAALNLE